MIGCCVGLNDVCDVIAAGQVGNPGAAVVGDLRARKVFFYFMPVPAPTQFSKILRPSFFKVNLLVDLLLYYICTPLRAGLGKGTSTLDGNQKSIVINVL